ncbi:DUF3810 domain-containing protein [Echinicola strongylocentroti]|uniref:DUF3810 domain-containing protein n=1 Tax=Echinicola strongylocentroti TaxID=1795355 RepID=A0A2Z4IK41_9BACT|nr:DUF3810 domain-containing protein [Echinicola strongylocentroti]AWW31069.1 DUF3810 domain-containing protein [Echinicola strongylocentroti]
MLRKNWTWVILGLVCLVIRFIAVQFPEATERAYSREFFPVVRNVIDVSIARLPFPTVYVFFLGLLLALGGYFWKVVQRNGWKRKLLFTGRCFLNFIGLLIFFFLVLWGFNYQRVPIFEQLGLKPLALEKETLLNELILTRDLLHQVRGNITEDTVAIGSTLPYGELEDVVRANIRENLYMMGLNFTGHPRTKQLYPEGLLRKLGILGIYFPFVGESYIDPTLHPLEKPFTIAHEMAHSYGVTDEGEANFIGWVICSHSDNPLLQYSGHLRLLSYQLNDLYRLDPDGYRHFLPTMDKGLRNDLIDISENHRKIKAFSLELSRRSNDLFLKSQGVKAGVKSYAQLPMLAYAWRNKLKGK